MESQARPEIPINLGAAAARCGPAFKQDSGIFGSGRAWGHQPRAALSPELRPPFSPALSTQRQEAGECAAGSFQRLEVNIRNVESESPALEAESEATPRRPTVSGGLRQVPVDELGGPGLFPLFGLSQSRLHHPGRPQTPSNGSLCPEVLERVE